MGEPPLSRRYRLSMRRMACPPRDYAEYKEAANDQQDTRFRRVASTQPRLVRPVQQKHTQHDGVQTIERSVQPVVECGLCCGCSSVGTQDVLLGHIAARSYCRALLLPRVPGLWCVPPS